MRDPQLRLFAAKAFAQDSDIGRLNRVIEVLPDEKLVRALDARENVQGRKRSHPARVLLHSVMAGVVYRHRFMSTLLEELKRNSDLREAVGVLSAGDVPRGYEMSRFLVRLVEQADLVNEMFAQLVHEIRRHVPDFGQQQAADSTRVYSYAHGKLNPQESSDPQASWGIKTRKRKGKDGKLYETVTKWFGYKLHLLVDTQYELPLAFTVTTATGDDAKELLPLVDQARSHLACQVWDRKQWEQTHQAWQDEVLEAGKAAKLSRVFEDVPISADAAYDEANNYKYLHQQYGMKAVIALVEHRDAKEGITVYERDRNTRVLNEETGQYTDLIFCGYEKDRGTLKYRCPCQGRGRCPYFGAACNKSLGGPGTIVRIKLSENWRYYTAIARGSKRWKREYKRRTAVERVNSRLKQVLEIERSGLRGQAKVGMRCALGVLVMVAHAVACLRAGKVELIRSMKLVA